MKEEIGEPDSDYSERMNQKSDTPPIHSDPAGGKWYEKIVDGFAKFLGDNGVSITGANNLRQYFIHNYITPQSGGEELGYSACDMIAFAWWFKKQTTEFQMTTNGVDIIAEYLNQKS